MGVLDQEVCPQGEGVSLGSKQEDVRCEKVAFLVEDVLAFPYDLVLQHKRKKQ